MTIEEMVGLLAGEIEEMLTPDRKYARPASLLEFVVSTDDELAAGNALHQYVKGRFDLDDETADAVCDKLNDALTLTWETLPDIGAL